VVLGVVVAVVVVLVLLGVVEQQAKDLLVARAALTLATQMT